MEKDFGQTPSSTAPAIHFALIDLDKIDPHPDQPRKHVPEHSLDELCASIRLSGLLQPIVLLALENERFQLIAGQRRLLACKRLRDSATTEAERQRYYRIEAIIQEPRADADTLRDAITENLSREDLPPLEAAEALLKLKQKTNVKTAKQLSEITGYKEDKIHRLLRLNDAPPTIKNALRNGFVVTTTDETPDSGAERATMRKGTRKLDMLEALEFVRLHKFYASNNPKSAADKTHGVMERAAHEGWGLRRIQEYVELQRAPKSRSLSSNSTNARQLFQIDNRRLLVHRDKIRHSSAEEKSALRSVLTALLGEIP